MSDNSNGKKIERPLDINAEDSKKKGIVGLIENVSRKFRDLTFFLLMCPIIVIYIICLGVSLTPGILAFQWIQSISSEWHIILKALCLGFAMGFGFIAFILTLIIIVPMFNFPIKPFVKSYRGAWFSMESIPWLYHNALTYLVRYTILEFLVPSPLCNLFFKMMGMKIGKGVMINTSHISDPCLITLEDFVTVGGSATLMAHYGMKGFLIIDKLVVKKGATIGLQAKMFGGVVVGEKATILPNSAVLPKTIIKENEKFGVLSSVIEK